MPRFKFPIHYAWVVVSVGMLGTLASLGFGRFALGMLLPSMGDSLSLSYSQMGVISTANFVGYLCSVLFCSLLVKRFGFRWVIFSAILTVGGSMLLVSQATNFYLLTGFYFLTGVGSGAAVVPLMGLSVHWFSPGYRGLAGGILVAGNGVGIMLGGTLVPELNLAYGAEGWRLGWLVLGSAVLAIGLLCGWLLRDSPSQKGLNPVGTNSQNKGYTTQLNLPAHQRRRIVLHLGAIYFLFGFTYVIYATFIVTTLVQEVGISEASAGRLWVWVGFFGMFSGLVFGWVSDRWGRKVGLMIVFFGLGITYLLAGAKVSGSVLYLSIGLFGFVAWSVPSIMAAAIGDYLSAEHSTAAFGQITFLFGIGQIIGPALAGAIAETSGSFSYGYYLSAILATVAVILSTTLPRQGEANPRIN